MTTRKVLNQDSDPERASGTALADAVKYTVMLNMAQIILRNSLQLGTYSNSAAFRATLLQCVIPLETLERIRPRHLEMERVPMMTGCKLTLSRKVRKRAKGENPTSERKSHDQRDQHEFYRHQHEQELWQTWTLGERLLDSRWRSV